MFVQMPVMDNGQRLMLIMKLLSECKTETKDAKELEQIEAARGIITELLYGDFTKWLDSAGTK